jgi:hypothetical protein
MIDNSGTTRSRPTPSKVEAITASAAAQMPFQTGKSRKIPHECDRLPGETGIHFTGLCDPGLG